MSKWELVRLGDIGAIVTGNTPSTKNSEYFCSDDIPFYKPSDIEENRITELHTPIQYIAEAARTKSRILPPESVLVTCIGTIGKVGVTTTECACNQQINAIIPNRSICNHKYLAYSILNAKTDLQAKANAPIVPIINKSNFSETIIPLPPLSEQGRIAQTLDAVAELLRLRKQQLAELDALVKSQFIEMFGEYFERKINAHALARICDFIDYRGKTPEKSEYGIPLITAKNVRNNTFSLEPREYIPEENYEPIMVRGIPRVNDILFTTEAPLGNVCRIPKLEGKFCVGQRLITIQPYHEMLKPEYVERALLSKEFQDEMWRRSSGSTVKGIRSKELVQLEIPVPPHSLQTQFADFVQKVEASKALVQKSINETQALFDSLMSEYFK